jgi:hypothetical protein
VKIVVLDIDGVLNSHVFFETRKKSGDDPINAETEAITDQLLGLMPTTRGRGLSKEKSEEERRKKLLGFVRMDLRNLDPAGIALLNDLLHRSGAKVVVSSVWRFNHTIEGLSILLRARGFVGEIIGLTPDFQGDRVRGLEIQDWLERHPEVTSFVIIDDDSDMDPLASRLVKTSFKTGITPETVERALSLLSRRD